MSFQQMAACRKVQPLPTDMPRAVPDPTGTGPLDLMGTKTSYEPNAEICAEEEPARALYKVESGVVRCCKLLSDGRRHISAFHLPGDMFGLEAHDVHRVAAEAVTRSTILVLDRHTVTAAAERQGDVRAQLLAASRRALQHTHEHLLLLGRKHAVGRVAGFLLELAARQPQGAVVELSMSRTDIADYLGLTIETVSRSLTELEDKRLIERHSVRRIVLRNKGVLASLDG